MKARRVKKLDPAGRLDRNAARILKTRLAELRDLEPKALRRDRVEAQHDLRIAAKRLRYVLEITGFCFGRPADMARRRARELQDILGEMHDCDVLLPRVREHMERLHEQDAAAVHRMAATARDMDPKLATRAPHRTAYRGLDALAVHLRARRELLFDRFAEFCRRQEELGTWLRLERALEAALREESAAASQSHPESRGEREPDAERAGEGETGRADGSEGAASMTERAAAATRSDD